MEVFTCCCCKLEKVATEFQKRAGRKRPVTSRCLDCLRNYHRGRYAANPATHIEYRRKSDQRRRLALETFDQPSTATCAECKSRKPVGDFPAGLRLGGVYSYCKECVNSRNREHYRNNAAAVIQRTNAYRAARPEWRSTVRRRRWLKNRSIYRARARRRYAENKTTELARAIEYRKTAGYHVARKRRYYKNREIVAAAKDRPCMDCKKAFPKAAMDFDHRPGEEKSFSIGSKCIHFAPETLMLEIKKCDVVCANCHRMRTHKRSGWHESYRRKRLPATPESSQASLFD